MPCANPAPKVHLASKWHVSSNWSKLQLKTPHGCWMFLISQEQFTMNKAMPLPVDSGINVTGVVGALGATSLPSIGHDTRCLHVGRSFESFGHFMCSGSDLHLPQGQGRQCPAVDPEHKTVKTSKTWSAPVLSSQKQTKSTQPKMRLMWLQHKMPWMTTTVLAKIHNFTVWVGRLVFTKRKCSKPRIPCCKCHAQPLRSAILGLQNWP